MKGHLGFISKASLELFLDMVPNLPTDIVTTQLTCFVVVLFRRVLWTVTMLIFPFSDGQEAPSLSLSSAAGCSPSSLECVSANGSFMAGSSVKSSSLRCSQKTDKAHGWLCSSPRCFRYSALVLHTMVFLCLKVILTLTLETSIEWPISPYQLQVDKWRSVSLAQQPNSYLRILKVCLFLDSGNFFSPKSQRKDS